MIPHGREVHPAVPVKRDYYRASDFIVKRFLLISHPASGIVIRRNCVLPNDVSFACNLSRVIETWFYLRYKREYRLPTNETLKMAFIWLSNKSRLAMKKLPPFRKTFKCRDEEQSSNFLKEF